MNFGKVIVDYKKENPDAEEMRWTREELHKMLDFMLTNGMGIDFQGIRHYEKYE